MGMSKSGNIARLRKVRDEITQKDDLESGKINRGFESKHLLRWMANSNQHDTNAQKCVVKARTDLRF